MHNANTPGALHSLNSTDNLDVNRTPWATGSLVIAFLLLCIWSIGGGLVSLFGTRVATVRHPHYMGLGE